MPYIKTTTTVSISEGKKEELTRAFGRAIELIPGKSEHWLMLKFEGDARMAYRGSAEDCAMVEVDLYGAADGAALDRLTGEISEILARELGLDPDRIYLRYLSVGNWGWNGANL